jgi:hypothetical protein
LSATISAESDLGARAERSRASPVDPQHFQLPQQLLQIFRQQSLLLLQIIELSEVLCHL